MLPRTFTGRRSDFEVKHHLENEHLIFKHAAIVRESLASYDPSATYWLDTFLLLGIFGDE